MTRPGVERWHDRLALVTGASVGIGAAVARALVQQGLKVVGCTRTVGNIEELAAECKSAGYPGTLIPYRCDLSNEEDLLSVFSALRSASTMPAWAGLTPFSQLEGDAQCERAGLSICTREAYQSMKDMSGHRVVPQFVTHFYSATKYAVTALTEGLRQELHDKDPEKAAATYEHIKCLQPEDVAEAVIYFLSTPPHVQIGDIQMRPTEQVT
uniref:Dehydrogenase/reductase 11 n=1 Tax=Aotus nancymaae TaxID=37293 RepID=A0A2K5CEZ4_AOTNA